MPAISNRLTLDPQSSLGPDQYTAAASGAGVDLVVGETALVVIITGAYGGTTPTASYKVQHSDDNSAWTDAADSDLIGATGNSSGVSLAASSVVKVSYIGQKRYVRVALSAVGGTSPVIRASGAVIRGNLRHTAGAAV